MKIKFLLLFLILPFLGDTQNLDVVVYDDPMEFHRKRTIDRHLKTMINLHMEIDSADQVIKEMNEFIDQLLNDIDVQKDEIEAGINKNIDLQLENDALIDSVNYHKVDAYGQRWKNLHLEEYNDDLKKENRW